MGRVSEACLSLAVSQASCGIHRGSFPSSSRGRGEGGVLSDGVHNTVGRNWISLMLSKNLICLSPDFFLIPPSSTLDAAEEEWASLAVSWTAEEAWCSLAGSLPHLPSPSHYHLGKGIMWAKSNCSSYPRQCVWNLRFCSNGVLECLWKPGLPQLSCLWWRVLHVRLGHGQEGLESVHKLLQGPRSGWRSVLPNGLYSFQYLQAPFYQTLTTRDTSSDFSSEVHLRSSLKEQRHQHQPSNILYSVVSFSPKGGNFWNFLHVTLELFLHFGLLH